MSRETIALDIDDVLSSQVDMFIEFSNSLYGMNLSHKDFQVPGEYWGYYGKVWGINGDELDDRMEHFRESHLYKQTVSEEVKDAINRMKAKYDLEIVTSRGAIFQDRTLDWLESHIPGVFNGVKCVELWNEGDEKATKAKVCQAIGAGYLVDDNAEHCQLAAEAGIKSLLFGDFGWNKNKTLHSNTTRVTNWQQLLEYFDA